MKNFKKQNIIKPFIVVFMFIGLITSCSEEDESEIVSSGPPVIESVSRAEDGDLTPTTIGYANNMYIIQGSGLSTVNAIYFNDTDTYFNPTLVTDSSIFVNIDQDTPYENASSILKVVTAKGTVTYTFVVAPPAPQILRGFNPINANEGDEVTIYGNFFLDPVVTFGTTEAVVVSNSLTEIVVKTPANSDDMYVTVTTISGSVTSEEVVGSALYDDVLQGDAGHWTWGGTDVFDTANTSEVAQGLTSIKFELGGWSGADMKFESRDVSQYKAFRVKVKSISPDPEASVKFVFGGWAYQITMPFTTEWTYIEIPFSDIGNPTTFDQLTLQESGNFGGNTFHFDNMGFVLK